MEFPGRWDVFAMEEFSTAIARSPGECGLEIMAQAKENGPERELLSCRHLNRLQTSQTGGSSGTCMAPQTKHGQ
jgi:hypothetical protein